MRFTSITVLASTLMACQGAELFQPGAPEGPSAPEGAIPEGPSTDLGVASSALHEAGEVVYTIVDMVTSELILIDAATNQRIYVKLDELPGWPGGTPLHSLVLEDKETVLISLAGSMTGPSGIVGLTLKKTDWGKLTVNAKVKKSMITNGPGNLSSFPGVTQVDPSQTIPAWTHPQFTQIHAPTLLPNSKFAYYTTMTDNRIRTIDTTALKLVSFDPQMFSETSRQTHGIFFNPEGTLGLGTGYFFDHNEIDVYRPNGSTGRLTYLRSIKLGTDEAYAAYTHHCRWLDERYAITGTMQLGPTSLTPAGATVLGPSMWLLDAVAGTAKKILGTAATPNHAGVYRSASDFMVARNKLYVAEEDTLGPVFGRDGFVSIYDVSDVENPVFLKRLKPGAGLPADFTVAHQLAMTPGEEFLYLESYVSKYILKIDTTLDAVVSVVGEDDGLFQPHGGFMSGQAH